MRFATPSSSAARAVHTVCVSDETASASTPPTSDKLGEVRFDSMGGLETFDGTNWVPLQEASDTDLSETFKDDTSGQS
jgi:hypothetical protein